MKCIILYLFLLSLNLIVTGSELRMAVNKSDPILKKLKPLAHVTPSPDYEIIKQKIKSTSKYDSHEHAKALNFYQDFNPGNVKSVPSSTMTGTNPITLASTA